MRAVFVGALALVAVSAAAAKTNTSSASSTSVTIAVPRSVDAAAIDVGIGNGSFSGEGVRVRVLRVTSSDAVIDAVDKGKAQFGLAEVTPLLRISANQAKDFQIVAGVGAYKAGQSQLLVRTGSGISTAGDLSSRIIGVSASTGIGEMATRNWLDSNSGDSNSIRFVALPTWLLLPVLQVGLVDAIVEDDPYTTGARKARGVAEPLSDPLLSAIGANATTSVIFGARKFIAAHGSLTKSVVSGITNADQFAQGNRSVVLATLPRTLGVARGVAAQAVLPGFTSTLSIPSLTKQADALIAYGVTTGSVDFSTFVWKSAPGSGK
jgi:NitT/TauT family transport system substrate-binding protein